MMYDVYHKRCGAEVDLPSLILLHRIRETLEMKGHSPAALRVI